MANSRIAVEKKPKDFHSFIEVRRFSMTSVSVSQTELKGVGDEGQDLSPVGHENEVFALFRAHVEGKSQGKRG